MQRREEAEHPGHPDEVPTESERGVRELEGAPSDVALRACHAVVPVRVVEVTEIDGRGALEEPRLGPVRHLIREQLVFGALDGCQRTGQPTDEGDRDDRRQEVTEGQRRAQRLDDQVDQVFTEPDEHRRHQ
jgi:hypothetical protein